VAGHIIKVKGPAMHAETALLMLATDKPREMAIYLRDETLATHCTHKLNCMCIRTSSGVLMDGNFLVVLYSSENLDKNMMRVHIIQVELRHINV
jgi:hypothetical protein